MVAGAGGQSPLGGRSGIIQNKKPTNREDRLSLHEKAVMGRAVVDRLRRLDKKYPQFKLAREARAIEGCGTRASVFECMGQRELWEGESIHVRHRLEKRVRCKRDFAPCCSEYDCNAHRDRANRIINNVWNVRLEKWVVTFGDSDIPAYRDQKALGRAMRAIYEVVEEVTGAEGAIISLHAMGDLSDRYRPHFEVMIPSDGTGYAKKELDCVRESLREGIAAALGLKELANAHFGYISKGLSPVEQTKKWFHEIRYAVHPVVQAPRFLRLPEEDAVFIVMLLRKLRRVRGFGVFGDRRIKKTAEDLRRRYPIDLTSDSDRREPEVYKGGPCPACGSVLTHLALQHALNSGREIASDLYIIESVDSLDLLFLKPVEVQSADTEDRETLAEEEEAA